MKTFDYQRANSVDDAVKIAILAEGHLVEAQRPFFIAGGTNLLDLMKLEIEQPTQLIDISRLPLNTIEATPEGGLKIGAMVSNSELAAHPVIRKDYAVLARALLSGASPQLRNKASTGGNLLQRTRCYYFYQPDSPCNKREPNSGCGAKAGLHQNLAILGTSEQCIATHPSDMAVAMRLLDAVIVIQQADGQTRQVPIAEFYRLPEQTPHIETCLNLGDLITHIILPPPLKGVHSYDKVRDRASYAFALVSVAAVIEHDNDTLTNVRLAFGGIGSQPWRNTDIEKILIGSTGDAVSIELAVATLFKDAKTDEQTEYKTVLVQRLLHHVVQRALQQPNQSSPLSSGVSA